MIWLAMNTHSEYSNLLSQDSNQKTKKKDLQNSPILVVIEKITFYFISITKNEKIGLFSNRAESSTILMNNEKKNGYMFY